MFFYGFILGVALGGFNAVRRKGNFLDILQYMAGYGIAFGLLALFIGIFWARMGWA
jgi:hypothetical protein